MSEASFIRRRWKLLLNIVTLVAMLGLIYAIRHQLADTLNNLHHVNAWVLLLLIPVEVMNYHAQARLYQGLFKAVDEKVGYKELIKVSLELNFVNHIFPSGGVTGMSYFGLRMRKNGIRGTKSTLVQTMKLVLVFLSFEILLIFGIIALSINGHASNFIIFIGTALSTLLIVGTFVFIYIIGSKTRTSLFLTSAAKFLNKLINIVRPRKKEAIGIERVRESFNDFHENYILLKSRYIELKRPFWWAFVTNVTEVLAIYVVYIAFGDFVNVGAVILAYAVANFAGLISVLPGGVGVYEALMTAVLVAAGVPASLSIPVTVMYRVLNTLLQTPPGYYFYHRNLHDKTVENT